MMSESAARITKIQRWIDLVSYLSRHHYPVSLESISQHVPAYRELSPGDGRGADPSVRRMFERDKDELRGLGLDIVSDVSGETSSYSLSMRASSLPLLRLVKEAHPQVQRGRDAFEMTLEPNQAAAVLSGLKVLADQPGSPLRAAARSALRKLSFDYGERFAAETSIPNPSDTISQLEDPETTASQAVLVELQRALSERKTLNFQYLSMRRGVAGPRRVDPWGILHEGGTWYLIGFDHDADDTRMFRVGRITAPTVPVKARKGPDFDVPKTFRIQDWAGRHPWHYGASHLPLTEVHVRFRIHRARWADRNGLGTLVAQHPDGSEERRFLVRDPDAFARWVLGMGSDALVLSPVAMAERVEALARVVWERHSDPRAHALSPTPGQGAA